MRCLYTLAKIKVNGWGLGQARRISGEKIRASEGERERDLFVLLSHGLRSL